MKMVIGIIRETCLGGTVKELEKINVRDMTISEVKGIGEQVTLSKPYAVHMMIQIIVPDDKVDEVKDVILKCARCGMAGDGIIVVSPIDYMIKIRTKERLE
ncbi:MAG: P-II family nitrogen regulator [Deltaproteobacteria bacterium]|nr:P-II family nitrogen regulator [Deltaproteobacteria bacterium]